MSTNEFVFDNGLKLITREMHHAPLAAFFVFYRVGGRNEVPGITGISHWVEHMMFKGTPKFGKGQLDRVVSKHGGVWNGFTTEDFTSYFEVLPAEHLELAIDIESDRMVNCLFDPDEVKSERTVIISEREGAENSPEFWLSEAVTRIAYSVHPYGQGVIGAKSDLLAMTRDDLYEHYKTYYAPNNAHVVACGSFDTNSVVEKVKTYFGGLAPSPNIPAVRPVEPPQQGERRVIVRRPGGACHVHVVFHVPQATHEDFYPLVVLEAVLSGGKPIAGWGGGGMGKSSRLYRALVETGLASGVGANVGGSVDPGLMEITLTAKDGVKPGEAEKAVRDVLDQLCSEIVPDRELERAKKQIRAQISYASEGAQQNALALGTFEVNSTWKEEAEAKDKVANVTADQVRDVASRYLTPINSTTGWFIPENGGEREAAASRSPAFFFKGFAERPKGGPVLGPDSIKRKVLSNGTVLLAHKNPSVDFITAAALVEAGTFAAPEGKEGLSRFTNLCLLRGTTSKSAGDINDLTDSLGMKLQASSGADTATVVVTALFEDRERALKLLGEVLMSPAFPEEQVERLKGQTITAIRQAESSTSAVAAKALNRALYPKGHPYRMWALGNEKDVASFTSKDLADFHSSFYAPEKTIVAIVSPEEPEEALETLEMVFEGWSVPGAKQAPERQIPVKRPEGIKREEVLLRGKTQCDIAIGLPALTREDPDYLKLMVTNVIAGQFGLGGRIGKNVRDEKGLAYYASSSLAETKGTGAWTVRAGVNPRGVQRALDAIFEEIEGMQKDLVSEEELSDVKGFLTGSLPISVESSGSLVFLMLNMEYYNLGFDYLEKYSERINQVTREDVLAAAKKYLSSHDGIVVIAGPKPR